MHFKSRNFTTYIKMHRSKATHGLQFGTQTKIYKLQTSSTNKHCAWKCKTKSKQTKGKGVGQVLLTSRGDGEINGVC